MLKPKPELADQASVYSAAVDLLSRRDYSRCELERKLLSRCPEPIVLHQVLDDLADKGWQSDERFAQVFARSRCQRGHGPLRIRQDMRQKGLSDSVIEHCLSALDIDWYELALAAAQKKYQSLHKDPRWREKLYRFLGYRGFWGDQIQYALEQVQAESLG